MRLTFINGSPRGSKSNTGRLMDHFIKGFLETEGNSCEIEYLTKNRRILTTLAEKFAEETLESYMGKANNPDLGFVIQ